MKHYLYYNGETKKYDVNHETPMVAGQCPIAILDDAALKAIRKLLKQRKEAGMPMLGAGEWAMNRARFMGVQGITLYY